jgi:putative hydrolase of the HAD superfamily
MEIKKNNTVFVFDLDDTLFKEIDFLISAYEYICNDISDKYGYKFSSKELYEKFYLKGINSFEHIVSKSNDSRIDINYLLSLYRSHIPNISISSDVFRVLREINLLGIPICILTDGRSLTQRNKIESLGLNDIIDHVIISEEFGSEKPDKRNYLIFDTLYPNSEFIYLGDNVSKDFITPNNLSNWRTIGFKDNGQNIHEQNSNIDSSFLPDLWLDDLTELLVSLKINF